jgi:hypothetical protein
MSSAHITPTLRAVVAKRSHFRCCYCQTAEEISGSRFTLDHIVPESLGGQTSSDNLCLACWECNRIKRDRITAFDPDTGKMVRLFNPNTQDWHDHFEWQNDSLLIIGVTPVGRATANALQLNRAVLVNARRLWVTAGWHPPTD